MPNQDIQFVVISADNNRKQLMQKQFKDLNIDLNFNIHFSEGITPNNSPYNLISTYPPYPESPETLCCFLSHIKAMKWYLKNTTCPYLLLLEDDVAIQKINFKENLLELLPKFKENNFDYISIGYMPHNISTNLLENSLIKRENNVYWDLYKVYLHATWGTQGQVFPRKTVESLLSIYDKSSIEEICKSILSYLNKNKFYYINPPRLQIDCLNGLLQHQSIVCPPLIIGYNNIYSLITDGDNQKEIWEDGEIRKLYKLNDYYSYNENNNLMLSKKIPSFKNYIMENIIDLVCKFGSNACEKFKSDNF